MDLIYLDHNSTTPLLPEVAAAMAEWQSTSFGNPASQHQAGRRARQALEEAREGIGRILGAQLAGRDADRIVFTSGGTEANNLALLGIASARNRRTPPGEAIVSAIEHPSIAAPADFLARSGWTIRRLGVTPNGVIDPAPLDGWLSERTALVSAMLANNETGVISDVRRIAERAAALGVPVHTDAVQMAGKLPVDFRALGVSSLSVAAHKFHGPLGIGALVARHDVTIEPVLFGGFQQGGQRPGTESVALAVGMHVALRAWQREAAERELRLRALRDRLEMGLKAAMADRLLVNGAGATRLPQTSNLALLGFDRQAVLMALDLAGVACSTGAACASGSSEPSRVLTAMGCEPDVLAGSLRFSLGATTTEGEIDEAIGRLVAACKRIAGGGPKRREAARPA